MTEIASIRIDACRRLVLMLDGDTTRIAAERAHRRSRRRPTREWERMGWIDVPLSGVYRLAAALTKAIEAIEAMPEETSVEPPVLPGYQVEETP